jgi:hypothetical protein
MIGTLGCVAACAGILGIEGPSEQGPMGDADGAVRDGAAVAPDVGEADAPAPVGDALTTRDQEAAAEPVVGVPCNGDTCTGGLGCCQSSLRCAIPANCVGSSFLLCDGPEDCDGGVCCANHQGPGEAFLASCRPDGCPGGMAVLVCQPGQAPCPTDCKQGAGTCSLVRTCGGTCL